MSMPGFVLPHESAEGPDNMALDEALLDEVSRHPEGAYLRTYGWSRPTLSLGYFQPIAAAEDHPRWRTVPLVRRATGGGAIWHHRELTYALVIPAGHSLARPSTSLYRAVHAAILDVIRSRGVDAGPRREVGPHAGSDSERPFLCFTDRDPEDIVTSGGKVVGSAQRRRVGAVLQHGSLLLRRSEATPELPGLSDLAGVSDDPMAWSEPIQASILRCLDLSPIASSIPEEIRDRAGSLVRSVYGNPAWTRRR